MVSERRFVYTMDLLDPNSEKLKEGSETIMS